MNYLAKIRKALYATLGGAAATIGGTMLDGNLTSGEVMAGIGAGLVLGFGTWLIPNAKTQG